MCLYPPNKRNWRLYYLLELDDSVTAKQVKWSFRRVTLRSRYQQAYFVLYSRARKHLYDAVGEDVYGFIVSGAWGPLISILGATGSIIIYCITMFIQVALLAIFFVFLAVKVENMMTLGWNHVIVPLIIFVMITNFFTFLSILVNLTSSKSYKEEMRFVDRISPVGNCLASVCYSCLPFLISSALTKSHDRGVGHYMGYMYMPILGDIFYYSTSLIWRWPSRTRLQMQIDDSRRRLAICYGIFLMAFLHMGCGIAQWVMLGQKLDRKSSHSWYVVFIPFCVRAGLRVVEALLRSLMRYAMSVRNRAGIAFDVIGSFFSNGILLISLYFFAVFLEQDGFPYSFFFILIPVYATLGYGLIGLALTMLLLLRRVARQKAAERKAERLWIPSDEKSTDTLVVKKAVDPTESGAISSTTSPYATGPVLGSDRKSKDAREEERVNEGGEEEKERGRLGESVWSTPYGLKGGERRSPSLNRSARAGTPPSRRSAVHRDPFLEPTSPTDVEERYYTSEGRSDPYTEGSYEYVSYYEYTEGSLSSSMSSSVVSSPVLKAPQTK